MIQNPAYADQLHRANQAARPAVASNMVMRKCACACESLRSIGQFAAGSTVCLRCARRGLIRTRDAVPRRLTGATGDHLTADSVCQNWSIGSCVRHGEISRLTL